MLQKNIKRMKIGLLTMPLHINYGGILQAYALKTLLERLGNEVIVFNEPYHRNRLPINKYWFTYLKRVIKKYVLFKKNHIFLEDYENRVYPILSKNIRPFIEKYFDTLNIDDVVTHNNQYGFNVLVVGSDQIWRPMYYPRIEFAFFSFAKDWKVKKIAYAASFGSDKWEYSQSQTDNCKQLAKKMDAISVREESGVMLCAVYLGVSAIHVLDPTLLLTSLDYDTLINNNGETQSNKGKLVTYVLDETDDIKKIIENISRKLNCEIVRANSKFEDRDANLEERIQPSIEQWLRSIKEAEFVIADSFHACVFSIIYHRNFLVVGNKLRGVARIESLLKMFHLENRIFDGATSLDSILDQSIDFESVDKIWNKMKRKSLNYLKFSLYER